MRLPVYFRSSADFVEGSTCSGSHGWEAAVWFLLSVLHSAAYGSEALQARVKCAHLQLASVSPYRIALSICATQISAKYCF